RWQKYGPRNSSGSTTTPAPVRAASATRDKARSRLSAGTPSQRICTRASFTVRSLITLLSAVPSDQPVKDYPEHQQSATGKDRNQKRLKSAIQNQKLAVS